MCINMDEREASVAAAAAATCCHVELVTSAHWSYVPQELNDVYRETLAVSPSRQEMSIDICKATHQHPQIKRQNAWLQIHFNRSRHTPKYTKDRDKSKKSHVLSHSLGSERQADTFKMSLLTACNRLPPHSLSLQIERHSQTVCLPSIPPCISPFPPPPSLWWSSVNSPLGRRSKKHSQKSYFSMLQMYNICLNELYLNCPWFLPPPGISFRDIMNLSPGNCH